MLENSRARQLNDGDANYTIIAVAQLSKPNP